MIAWVTAEEKRYIVVSAASCIFLETMTNPASPAEDLMYIQAECMNQCWQPTNCNSSCSWNSLPLLLDGKGVICFLLYPLNSCYSRGRWQQRLVRAVPSCHHQGVADVTWTLTCCGGAVTRPGHQTRLSSVLGSLFWIFTDSSGLLGDVPWAFIAASAS